MYKRLMAISGLLTIALLASVRSTESAETDSAPLEKITTVEGITEYRLDNGLKILLFPDPSKPNVTVNLTVFVGSRHEGYGEAGMAHLLEHMLFKGTPTHANIPQALQSRGANFNGTTWVDRTNYYETLPATDENLEFAIRLEADRMVNSLIREEDLASEMTVVRNEFERGENRPAYVLSQKMMSAAYQWHNYGQSTIGNRADIERVPIENLREFYRKYYQPDNAMLVIAGQFDPDKALAAAQKYFGAIPKPERKLPTTYTEEPPQDGERIVTLRRVGDVSVVGAVYHIPAGPHPDYASVDVLESILTATPSGRLYKALVESKKAASISGAAFAWHDPGVLRLMSEVAEGNAPEAVLDTLLDVVEQVGEKGVTQEEVDRAKQRLLKEWELATTDSRRIAIELSEWAAQGDWRLFFLYRDRVEQVTVDDVNRVAREYLKRNNRTVGIYYPTKESDRVPIPATPDVASLLEGYTGREDVSLGEAFDVSPENIESRTQRHLLPSGLQVTLLEKKTRGEMVNVRLSLRYGNEDSLAGRAKATSFLPRMMLRGTTELTRSEIQDLLDKYRARLNASGNPGVATFTLQTRREHLPAALEVFRQVLREPSFPENELDVLKQAELANLEQRQSDPTSLATLTVNRALNPYEPNDPRYIPTISEERDQTRAVTVDDLKSLYQEYLGAEHGQLTIVGDFDTEEVLPRLTEILADWKSDQSYERIVRHGDIDIEGTVKVILTPDKANATYFAGTVFPMRDDHPDYPALVIGDHILGGGSLSSRLGDRVRQRDGLSYGVGSGVRSSSVDPRTTFYMYAIANPENMEKVKQAIREELERIRKEGVTEEELANAKQGYLQGESVSRSDDSNLARILEENTQADRTMRYQEKLETAIEELTADQVQSALQKYADYERLIIVTAGDFEGASQKSQTSAEENEDSSDE